MYFDEDKLLSTYDCKVGMRVVLASPDRNYSIGGANPAVDSRYECEGTVVKAKDGSVSVSWDNGSRNGYKDYELAEVDGPEGMCDSIWDNHPLFDDF